jgi:hypothetical protein
MADTRSRVVSVALCPAALGLCLAPAAGKHGLARGTRSAVKLLEERPHKGLCQLVVVNRVPSARSLLS